MSLGPLTFLEPVALWGLLSLPLIWWLLRVVPPTPKQQSFPPLSILRDIVTDEETPSGTPLWLLLFRLLMITLIAVALARPILFKTEGTDTRPLTLIIDNGWDNAPGWNTVIEEAEAKLTDARRKNLPVWLMVTGDTETAGFAPADEALRRVRTLQPSPWPSDRDSVTTLLKEHSLSGSDVLWLSSSFDFSQADALQAALAPAASAIRMAPTSEAQPIMPGATEETADGFRSVWVRADESGLRSSEITAVGRDGRVIARSDLTFAPGETTAEADFTLPSELRNRIASLRADNSPSAASVKLFDDSWGRPVVGVLTPERDEGSPLLSEPFYARTALAPYADIYTGPWDTLVINSPSIIIMPDAARVDAPKVREFVENGGLLIRFGGPKLAARPDTLLPVLLRDGGRDLGGALTWEDPLSLAPFSEDSPFFGLNAPEDIKVRRQVMAQPGAETDTKTWARLTDGSPVVTSAPYGTGRIVLFHVTAGPEWSDLPVSGLYVDMLRRLLPLARAAPSKAQSNSTGDWAAESVLTGFGRLTTPGPETRPLPDNEFATSPVSAAFPPGLYRQGTRSRARNTVTDPKTITLIQDRPGVTVRPYGETREQSLTGLLLGLAMLMLIIDAVLALNVSGRLSRIMPRRAAMLSALLIAGLWLPDMARAEDPSQALSLHLAYVKTGDNRTDGMSQAAMEGLVEALNGRTTIEPTGVKGVVPGQDPLVFYPFLYWPISTDAQPLSEAAVTALNNYMSGGGTIIFDTQDAGDRFTEAGTHPGLSRVTRDLDIPPLTQVPTDHVLTKSFYLIQVYPGRWAQGPVWVDRNAVGAARDGVSSVIIGSNDWAAAWALGTDGKPLIDIERDIPRQREKAIRFGVNIAMYALAGNYKGDQVHAAALIERLGTQERQPRNLGPADKGEE